MQRGMILGSAVLFSLVGAPLPAASQALVEQMPLADLQKCGALSLDMWTSAQDLAEYDQSLKAIGVAIRSESDATDAARHRLQIQNLAEVKRFNARVIALNARVAAYRSQVGLRNAMVSKANDFSLQFNVLCANRPYSLEMAATLPAAQARSLARGASSVEIPSIDNATGAPLSPTGPPGLTVGGPGPPPAADDAAPTAAAGGFKTADALRAKAEDGDAEAQYLLGESYVFGGPFGRNDASALTWLSRSADQGNAKALFSLSVMYDEGRGAPADAGKSHAYLVKAADLGDAQAEHNLALWYAAHEHDAKAERDAVTWMAKAAEQGDPESQFLLSDYYARGYGGAVSSDEVMTWLRKSALQGYRPAQLEIGRHFEKADGVARDVVEALKWDLLAAGGVSDADRLDASKGCLRTALEDVHTHDLATAAVARLQGKLSPEESDRAARLAETWRTTSGAKAVEGC